jgi:hypothetical protein
MEHSVIQHPVRQTGFTIEELRRAFDQVIDTRDWMGPILSIIPTSERRLVGQAIIWFTSTIPAFGALPGHPERLVVSAAGYRCGPAGRVAGTVTTNDGTAGSAPDSERDLQQLNEEAAHLWLMS